VKVWIYTREILKIFFFKIFLRKPLWVRREDTIFEYQTKRYKIMRATFTHRTLKDQEGNPEVYSMGGVEGLAQAWSLLDFAAGRMGWNPASVNDQVIVSVK
jgi:hypothetical protein